MKIDLLVGDNLYGTTVHFAKGLAASLERLGVATRLFWVAEGHFFHALYDILADPPDFTCSFSDISLNHQSLGELWQIPHLSWLVDPPIYFLHQLQGSYSYVGCVDEADLAFVNDLGCTRSFFLPHAADICHLTAVDQTRPYQAVFFGSCIDYEAIAAQWPKHEQDLLLAASSRVLSADGVSIMQALQELGVAPIDLPRYHGEVDQYTRGRDRIELIRSWQAPVHIWGVGPWKKYFPNHPIHPSLSFAQTLEIMKKSQIVLNSAPRFKAGGHERIFYALICGAAVYTGENRYLSTELPELVTYRFGEWQKPQHENWQAAAYKGQQRVLASHTWDCRAKMLVNQISKVDV